MSFRPIGRTGKLHSDVLLIPSVNFTVGGQKFCLDFRQQSHLSSGFEMEKNIGNLKHLARAAIVGLS